MGKIETMIPNGTCPSRFVETSQNFPLCEKEISHPCTRMYTGVFFPGTRLRHACDLMTDPRGSFLLLLLFWRRVLRAAPTPWELVADAPSLLPSSVCRSPSFSGIVPAPGDAQRELCPVPLAAVVDGGADFSFVQTVPPRDLVSLTELRLLSDGRVVSVARSEMRRGSRMDVHRAAGTCGHPTRRCLDGGGEGGETQGWG